MVRAEMVPGERKKVWIHPLPGQPSCLLGCPGRGWIHTFFLSPGYVPRSTNCLLAPRSTYVFNTLFRVNEDTKTSWKYYVPGVSDFFLPKVSQEVYGPGVFFLEPDADPWEGYVEYGNADKAAVNGWQLRLQGAEVLLFFDGALGRACGVVELERSFCGRSL